MIFDIAQQSPSPIEWLPIVLALIISGLAWFPWRKLRLAGRDRHAMVYAVTMFLAALWVIRGSAKDHFLDEIQLRGYRDWSSTHDYCVTCGKFRIPSGYVLRSQKRDGTVQAFRVGDEVFRYGQQNRLNDRVSPEMIELVQKSGKQGRVYHIGSRILRIEMDEEKVIVPRGRKGDAHQIQGERERWNEKGDSHQERER